MMVIDGLRFSLFSPEQIRRMSAIKITVPDTYDEDGYPISGGLADQRLGVIDPGLKCKTCGGRMRDCGGHFGHIELVRPVVHAGFAKAIYQLLKATCRKCGRLMHPSHSLSKIKKMSECPHCNEKQRPVKFIKPTTFYEDDRKLLPNEVRERLERIPDEDLNALNVKVRPEWMVLTVLIVPPVTVRPSITLETGERSEDDLTHKLVDIIRINQRLEENVEAGAPQLIIEDLWELLQYHVSTYFDNEIAGIPPARHRSGRQLKTLFQRLKGKEGRFRYNLSGKRVNFSARTVISPDPTLGINELGVPEEIAAELTLPVAVTLWNVENLKEIIRSHPEKINYIIRPDSKRKKLTTTNLNEVLEELAPGYVVERQLMDDDVVIFNRQPSLHRVSMMCHSIKVLPGKTFRFNVADCRPYNADFDGDEMNIHVPQNEEAQSEAEVLMKVEDQTLSPRNGKPIISPDLDQVSGLYILTLPETEFDRADAAWLMSSAGVQDPEVIKSKISGREVFSSLLPADLTVFLHAKRCKYRHEKDECDNPACVKIKNGKLLNGQVDSKISEDLVSLIAKQYGGATVRTYIDNATRLTVQLATRFGLSLSLDDYYMPPEARKDIIALYKEGRTKLRALVHQFRSKKLKRLPGKTLKETLEEQVMEIVEGIRHDCWKIVKKNIKTEPVYIGSTRLEHNPATLMAQAGVKNKPINVVQMTALVGQQAVRGKRMTSGYRRRILPHFKAGDLSESARGFVRNSYKQGLSPTEYFFHAAGGRDSVVDKGVNPAKTGYMQRRLINALQDLIVENDRSVRDSSHRLIQTVYGDDGMDPMDGKPVAPGEPVGVIAAQSIGEPGTQMTLRTFHYAGVASLAQLGFTRLVEIVDGRKTPKKPVMEIYLKKPYSTDFEKAKMVAANIEEVTLDKVAQIEENFTRKAVTITLNRSLLQEKAIKESEVLAKIKEAAGEYEPDKEGNEIHFKPKNDSLKNIRKLTNKLRETHLKGIPGIKRAIIVEKEDDDKKILTLATEGSNLEAVFKLEEVDVEHTTTNDIMEVARTLGIEAGRNAIVQEMNKVLEAQGLRVDARHIMLIADAMTASGFVQSVGRHGLAGHKASVLARAAFEETGKHLVNACLTGEEDSLNGIIENIIAGQIVPCGTGNVKLTMSPDYLG